MSHPFECQHKGDTPHTHSFSFDPVLHRNIHNPYEPKCQHCGVRISQLIAALSPLLAAFEYAEWALERAITIKMGLAGEDSTRAQGQADALRVVLSYYREAKAKVEPGGKPDDQ